jgi:hypothetical protein
MYESRGNCCRIVDNKDESNRRKVFFIITMKDRELMAEQQKLKESSCDMVCSRCSRVDCKNR